MFPDKCLYGYFFLFCYVELVQKFRSKHLVTPCKEGIFKTRKTNFAKLVINSRK
jgi:hypothetical protein